MLAAEKIIIPGVDEGDADEVRDGLEVASSLWRRGDVDEALKWLRRAAKAADVSGDEARSEMLYEAAVKLSAPQAEPLTEPPESEPELPPFAEHQESTWKIKSHERKVLNTGMRPTTPPDDVLAGPDRDMAPANDSTGSPSLVALGELYERTGRWAQLAEAEQPQLAEDPTTRPHGSSQFEQLDVHRPDFFEQLEALQLPWEAVIELCFNRIDTTVELAVQTSLLRSVGRVLDAKLRDPEQAFEVLITAFELDLSDERTVVDLEKVTAGMKRWPELVQRVNGWLERATEPRLQAALCLRLAKWYGAALGRPDFALGLYSRVVQLDPNNVRALRQVAEALLKQGDWRQAGLLLEQAQRHAQSDADKAAIFTELGDLLSKLADQEEKRIAYYQRAIEADGSCVAALTALATIYDEKDMTSELCELLDQKAVALSAGGAAAEAATVHLRRAGLLELVLAKPREAIEAYRSVLDTDAANVLALGGLERICRAANKWLELGAVLEMRLDVAQSGRERAELSMQIARLQEQHFLRPDLAARRLEHVVELDPTSAEAFTALSGCYRKMRQWHDTVDCLRRSLRAADGKDDKVAALTQIAHIFDGELQDQQRAERAYLDIAVIDDEHLPTLEALAKLYEAMGKPARTVDCMKRVVALTTDRTQQVEAHYAIGKQLVDELGDQAQAREHFEEALDLDSTHLPTLAALGVIAQDQSDWHGLARYLDAEQHCTTSPTKRARLLTELGRLNDEMLQQPAAALEAYQLARQVDPNNFNATLCLARRQIDAGAFAEAEPLTEQLRKSAGREPEQQIEINLLHAEVEMALGKPSQARSCYLAVRKLELTNQDAIWGLAEANFQLGDWAAARSQFHNALACLSVRDRTLRAEVYFKLGCIERRQRRPKAAIEHLEKALRLDAGRRELLEELAGIYQDRGDWDRACSYRQQVLDKVQEPAERCGLLRELAAIHQDEMGAPKRALELYEQVASLQPDDHELLHRMLPLYHAAEEWEPMIDALQRIIATDPKPARRARYLFTMAQIYLDKLRDSQRAAELFDEALDLDPKYLDAFGRLEAIHRDLADWQRLEKACRKMIHRIAGAGQQELERSLWCKLGLVYRDHLDDLEKAADALRAAVAVAPEAIEERLLLCDLADEGGQVEDALDHYRAIIERDPRHEDAYHGMYVHHLRQGAYDEAWCCAAVLCFLGAADEDQQLFFEDWRPTAAPELSGRLGDGLWSKHLLHQDEDRRIGKIFEAIASAALAAKLEVLTAAGQRPVLLAQERHEPRSSTVGVARALWWASEVLSVRAPELYLRSEARGGLQTVVAAAPCSLAGGDVCSGLGPLEQLFVVGQHLAMNRGEHFIKALFQTKSELTVFLYAAIGLIAPQAPVPRKLAVQVQATVATLSRFIGPQQREQLKYAVKDFLAAGGRGNIKRWGQAVATSAARAGLLLAGDLEIAQKILSAQPQIPGDLSPTQRIDDLLRWFVSDSFFVLRKKLGIEVEL